MLSTTEVRPTMQQFEDKLEEIRTICRLHAYPTGHWENLVDLPFRLSQDSGLRADIVEIVRSLQRSSLNLPDVLDLIVLAVGGASAAGHSRELSDPLNQIGGFLSSVGRWPNTDTSPVLAPGEVPENLERFMRPQPPLRAVAQRPQQAVSSPPAPPPQPAARPVRLFEVPSKRPAASVRSALLQPALDQPHRDQQQKSERSNSAELLRKQGNRASDSPSAAQQTGREQTGTRTPDFVPADSTSVPAVDISQALGRLERGNLELRAHLDSIDQRISRMEPLLESGAPPDISHLRAALSDLTAATGELPTLLHRESASREPVRAEHLQVDPIQVEPMHPEPLRTTSLHPDPIRTDSLRTEPLRTEPLRANSAPSTSAPVRFPSRSRNDDSQPDTFQANNGVAEPLRRPTTNQPDRPSSAPVNQPVPPRFSRFSRDPASAEPAYTDPAPASSLSIELLPTASKTDPLLPSAERRPITLPRGFFGTLPEPDETTVEIPVDPPRDRRRFPLIITALILLGLIVAAAALYMRNVAGDGDPASGITPVPAPRTPGPNPYATQGALPASPTRSAPAQRRNPPESNAASARIASPPRETAAEEPTPTSSFRPAPNFVPASVMDGHLIAASLPSQPRFPASSGAQGVVVLEANISSSGQVEDLYVLGGNRALRPAALDAVRNWRYKPYLLNGTPVEVRTIVRVDFTEHRSQPAER